MLKVVAGILICLAIAGYFWGYGEILVSSGVGLCAFYLTMAFSFNHLRSFDKGQWPSILLTEDKLKIRQEDSLLWSKGYSEVDSVKVEKKSFFGISQNAILIQCKDKDSYYLNVAKKLDSGLDVDQIAHAIKEKIAN